MLINLEGGHTSKSKAKILIIDDDKDITNLFAIFLEYNGYIINAYTNPLEASITLERIVIFNYSWLKMPMMEGLTLYHFITTIIDSYFHTAIGITYSYQFLTI